MDCKLFMNLKLLMGPDLEQTEHKLASTRARERILTSILKLLATKYLSVEKRDKIGYMD